jgi:ABC-type nitrate/sulfonate/bicarbonate transport system substrate-binding protein
MEIVLKKSIAEAAGLSDKAPLAERARALKGKKIAVQAPNGVPHAYLRYVARLAGLDPEREVTIASMQPEAAFAALKTGAIDGFNQGVPWAQIAVQRGEGVMLTSGLKGDQKELTPFAFNVVVTRAGRCEEKPTLCERLMAGFVDGMNYILDHPKESLRLLDKWLPGLDPAAAEESFELIRRWTPRSAKIKEEGFVHSQQLMLAGGMLREDEKLSSFADLYTNKYKK